MRKLGLPDLNTPTLLLNNNQGSVDWVRVESKCKATQKLQHKNISEFKIAVTRLHDEINILWIPGKMNPAETFTKEGKDVRHYEGL